MARRAELREAVRGFRWTSVPDRIRERSGEAAGAPPQAADNTLPVAKRNTARGHSEVFVPNPSGAPRQVPQTLKDVDLPGRIRAAGGASLKEAGEFFGWEPARVTKTAADFTKDQLLAKGWTKERLVDVAEGYEHISRITPSNPSAAGRAKQLREIAILLD
jgi:hypothetical protein